MTEHLKSGDERKADSRQLIKLAIDLGPLLLFFAGYVTAGIYWATGLLMVAMPVAVVVSRIVLRHVSPMLLATTALVLGFGAMTLWLHDPRFIKMKPTIINLIFAAVLLGGLAWKRLLLKNLLGEALRLTEQGWRLLTIRWAMFFVFLAVLNEVIWRNLSETTWASFKVFGILPLTMLFFATQWPLIQRHQLSASEDADDSSNS
ncbi:MAG: septation protein A [Hyphomicrobiaceae bacterium]